MTSYLRFDTPLGPMVAIAAGGALASVDFTDARYARSIAYHQDGTEQGLDGHRITVR